MTGRRFVLTARPGAGAVSTPGDYCGGDYDEVEVDVDDAEMAVIGYPGGGPIDRVILAVRFPVPVERLADVLALVDALGVPDAVVIPDPHYLLIAEPDR